ncbi:MAG: hypothetical protein WD873_05750, partial [Candidatus Hydrogenedentales bacterium]
RKPVARERAIAELSGAANASLESSSDQWRAVHNAIRVTGAGLAATFAASVLLFAAFGEPWVQRLDDEIGEIVAGRATEQADQGQNAAAIDLYRRALEVEFEDPMQRVWTLHRLAGLLLKEERYDEAVLASTEALQLDDNNGAPYSYINRAYYATEQYDEMAANAEQWFAWGEAKGKPAVQADARHQFGIAQLLLGRREEAIAAFEESFAIRPHAQVAFDAARHLVRRGDHAAARPYLEYVAAHAKDWRRSEAQSLLDQSAAGE